MRRVPVVEVVGNINDINLNFLRTAKLLSLLYVYWIFFEMLMK